MTMRKSAIEALEENHLWPLMTQPSPSRTARVRSWVGSEPAVSGSVIEKADFRSPASSGCSQRSFCSSVPASARISELPESGAWLPNALGANGRRAQDLVHEAELDLAEALAAELGRQVRGPQPAALDLLLQRRVDARRAPADRAAETIVSSGQISSRTKARIQSSCSWNSGSVEKSHAMAVAVLGVAIAVGATS